MGAFRNLSTQRFGRLLALYPIGQTAAFKWRWVCRCACGNTTCVVGGKLTGGFTKSCGCWDHDVTVARNLVHGQRGTAEYEAWKHMIHRCTNAKYHAYHRYGGRGITVCDEWRHDFLAFFHHIGPRPTPQHSLDRINNDGPYAPGNVKWSTKREQRANQSTHRRIHP